MAFLTTSITTGQVAQPVTGDASFRVFLRGSIIGSAETSLTRSDDGWLIKGTGRLAAPLDLTIRRLEVRYSADWKPQTITLELRTPEGNVVTNGTFQPDAPARIDVVRSGQETLSTTPQVAADAIIVPNLVYSAYEALAVRLMSASPGIQFPAYIVPQGEIAVRVDSVREELIQTPGRTLSTRRWQITFLNPSGEIPAEVWVEGGRLVRFDMPSQSLSVARADVAAVSSRVVTGARPNDEQVFVRAAGFNLAATVSKPATASEPLPAVILVGGSAAADRDETVAGVAIFSQLAGSIAEAGYLVVRYDKRGTGQSGGRTEVATLGDFAEDVRAIVQFLRTRKDVDDDRIAVFGYSEGAAVGLIAADRERRIAALVLAGGAASKGLDLTLEQQRRLLEQSPMSEAERQKAIDLQQQILNAVVTGKGWEGVAPDIRRQADTPLYQSLLTFDPDPLFRKVQQPILVLHGELDRQMPIHHAEELAQLARGRAKGRGSELVKFPTLNHLFVPATTGEVSEYATLKDVAVSPDVSTAVVGWLNKTLPQGK
jgi:pimeloyl-ACP methyl ester carboxylesterase